MLAAGLGLDSVLPERVFGGRFRCGDITIPDAARTQSLPQQVVLPVDQAAPRHGGQIIATDMDDEPIDDRSPFLDRPRAKFGFLRVDPERGDDRGDLGLGGALPRRKS